MAIPKPYRLRHNASFSYIYKNGKREKSHLFTMYYVESFNLKIGVSINRKVGKAVVRNLIKRRINYAFMQIVNQIKRPYNYVFVVSKEAKESSYEELNKEVKLLLKKARHIEDQEQKDNV